MTTTNGDIFALLKPRLEDIAFFLQYVGRINKCNSCTSYKWISIL